MTKILKCFNKCGPVKLYAQSFQKAKINWELEMQVAEQLLKSREVELKGFLLYL